MANLFEGKNWDATKEALLEGLEGSKKNNMAVVLENTKQSISSKQMPRSLNKVIQVIRRYTTVIANELVGVRHDWPLYPH